MLHSAALVALIAGATGSLTLLLMSARHTPAILIFLYTGWVLLPYVTLAAGRSRLMRRSAKSGALMSVAALIVVGAAITAYVAAALMRNAPRPAAVFLMVPLASQVLAAAAYAVAAVRTRPT